MAFTGNNKIRRAILITFAVAFSNCAPLQPASTTGPRGSESVYPVLVKEDIHRKDAAITALNKLLPESSGSLTKDFALQPITSTIESLPPSGASPLYLPKVGAGAIMNEEETRESLRRFIRDWQELIGSDPARLSLVEHVVQPDGSNLAIYEQRPFRFPLRGNYGKLEIRFAADRRIISLSSTCIPDADRVRSALRALGVSGALSAQLTAEDAVKKLPESDLPYSDGKGAKLTYRTPAGAQVIPRELVTYVQASSSGDNVLEFHIAWEIELSNAPVKLVYVDAIIGEIIAAK